MTDLWRNTRCGGSIWQSATRALLLVAQHSRSPVTIVNDRIKKSSNPMSDMTQEVCRNHCVHLDALDGQKISRYCLLSGSYRRPCTTSFGSVAPWERARYVSRKCADVVWCSSQSSSSSTDASIWRSKWSAWAWLRSAWVVAFCHARAPSSVVGTHPGGALTQTVQCFGWVLGKNKNVQGPLSD